MRIAVLHPQTAFVRGGAETHAESLVRALKAAGHDADLVQLAGKWYPPSQLAHQMAVWRSFDITESNGLKVDAVDRAEVPGLPRPARAQDRLVDPPAPDRVRAVGSPRLRRPQAPGRRRCGPRHGVGSRPGRPGRGEAGLHELHEREGPALELLADPGRDPVPPLWPERAAARRRTRPLRRPHRLPQPYGIAEATGAGDRCDGAREDRRRPRARRAWTGRAAAP